MPDQAEGVSETRNKGGRPRKLNPDEATREQSPEIPGKHPSEA